MTDQKKRDDEKLPPSPIEAKYPKAIGDCDHTGSFLFNVVIGVGKDQGTKLVLAHLAVIRIVRCGECGQRFRFVGVDRSESPSADEPVASRDGLELTAPVEPDLVIELPPTRKIVRTH